MVLAAEVLYRGGVTIQGPKGVVQMSVMLEQVVGPVGRWAFLIGFWGAVVTSMMGVWQGVPYLFSNFVGLMKGLSGSQMRDIVDTRSPWYRGYLLWLCLPPMVLLTLQRPIGLIVLYAVMGALFMPFLAGTLLYMNTRSAWVGERLRNRWWTNLLLLICLALFAYLGYLRVVDSLGKLL